MGSQSTVALTGGAQVEPPQIRIHKFEHTVAIKWEDQDCWWVMEPPPGPAGWAHPAASFDDSDTEWVDPAVDHRKDLSRWTQAVRRDLASIEQVLKSLEQHPY